MEKMEPYTVEIPSQLELHASGVKVGDLVNVNSSVYIQNIRQRVFMPDLIEGVEQYARRLNKQVEYCLYDPEYDRFEFKLKAADPLPRKLKDNPQA